MEPQPGDEQRSIQLLLAICDRASETEYGRVTRGEVGPSIGLDPDNNFDDDREFMRIARKLYQARYITRDTTRYENFRITNAGLAACARMRSA